MKVSHSRVSTFKSCPFSFKLNYIDGLEALPTDDPSSPLILGTAMHTGIEKDTETAIKEYFNSYPVINDLHINESIKLEYLIPKAKALAPEGIFEFELDTEDFKGFIDLLVPVGDNTFDIIDFKYSNNEDRYKESPQIHLYKYFFEKKYPQCKINHLYYLMVPKTQIRQKKTEDLNQFRMRLIQTLQTMEPRLVLIEYDISKVTDWLLDVKHLVECNEFPKNETRLCDWCSYKNYCLKGIEIDMALPKNERVPIGSTGYMKGWIYGPPFSGKTTFLDKSPDPLNLNTDGNTKYVTMQRVLIRDTYEGRLKKLGWEVLKEYISDLEKGSEFKTVILDLVEDTREMCRLYMYDKLGIMHESDAGFGKGWDIIKTEYLSTMRRLLALDYNIFLCSHEDISKDITKKSGDKITKIAPNIQDAIANKLAGMVDFVARVVVNDDGTRKLSFKANEVTFGGGRLTALNGKEIPLDWNELVKAYNEAKREITPVEIPSEESSNEESSNEIPGQMTIEETISNTVEETPKEEATKTRRTRKARD